MPNPIQILSTDGVTSIIDGVSDVFRIVASGTITIATGPALGQSSSGFVDNIIPISTTEGGVSNVVANLWFSQGVALPNLAFNLSTGALYAMAAGNVTAGSTPGTYKAIFTWYSATQSLAGLSATVRYFLLSQTGQ
jgi:hypothetical protein